MAQAVAHGGQAADGLVEFLRFAGEQPAVDGRAAVGREHAGDLVEGEAGGAAERDQGEAPQHVRLEQTPETPSADGFDQAFFLVEAERRSGKARARGDLADVENFPLDFKST